MVIGKESSKKSLWLLDAVGTAIVLGMLAWLSQYSFLAFHSLAELFSIVVASAIFVIAWNARNTLDNGYFLFLGIALLFVAGIDLVHMLSYNGMGVFTGYGADLPTQLWIAGRMLESLSLLAAPFFLSRRLHQTAVFTIYLIITALVLFATFSWKIFPACYVEGYGLTPFKISAEYAICFVLLLALGNLFAYRRRFQNSIHLLLCCSILATILSELAFTRYASIDGNFNMAGHLLKVLSVIFIYKAIVETGFRRPYDLLYRNLSISEQRYRSFVEASSQIVWTTNSNGEVNFEIPAWQSFTGQTAEQARGFGWMHAIHQDDRARVAAAWTRAAKAKGIYEVDYRLRIFDGTWRNIIARGVPVLDASGQVQEYVGTCIDITERKQAEDALQRAHSELEQKVLDRTEELRRTNRTLRMISECNESLVRSQNEQDLMQDICRIIVEVGGYRMAWVGYSQNDDDKTVLPVASMGFEEGYLETVRISWADTERGRGPTGTCIRTGKICISHNFLEDPQLAPWKEEALQRGYLSSVALPLKSGGRTFGAITIYASEPHAFDSGSEMIRELAEDLAFGIRSIQIQIERDRAHRIAETRAGQLQALATELVQAEQKERRQLARILHDHLQQLLVAAKMEAGFIRRKSGAKDVRDVADSLIETLDESIRASRSLTADLSPPILHEQGLAAGLKWLGRRMHEKHGLMLEVQTDASGEPAAEQVRTFLFEAARELLLNIVKHAKVLNARVHLQRLDKDEIALVISDEGAGFDPEQIETTYSTTGGFGLFSIRERLSYLGGRMNIESAPGQGSRFTLIAPFSLAQQSSP